MRMEHYDYDDDGCTCLYDEPILKTIERKYYSILYTDKILNNLSFKQLCDEGNSLFESVLGKSECPKCGYVSWVNGDGGSCLPQIKTIFLPLLKPDSKIPSVIDPKYVTRLREYLKLQEDDEEEKALKLILKYPILVEMFFVWECVTCKTRFLPVSHEYDIFQ